MANEKVDVVIVGAGASGSIYAAVLAKAGKKVVVLEQGPDWQLSDLISSDFWGRRDEASGRAIPARRQEPGFATATRAAGASAVPRCTISPTSRGCCPTTSGSRASTTARTTGRFPTQDVAPYYDKVARDIGVSGDAKAEEIWRPAGDALSDAADEDLP